MNWTFINKCRYVRTSEYKNLLVYGFLDFIVTENTKRILIEKICIIFFYFLCINAKISNKLVSIYFHTLVFFSSD